MELNQLHTKIFLDSGDPEETKQIIRLLGLLNGQTTNPTLVAKNPTVQKEINQGRKYRKTEILDLYRNLVKEISELIPKGSVSIEVYADKQTPSGNIIDEARTMFAWLPNAHIKLPITTEGLAAAEQVVKEGIRVNMTLCFSEEQAAAVYIATKGAKKGDVFISPFIGRLDDLGDNGMDLVRNMTRLYRGGDGHVEILSASVRNLNHLLGALNLKSDIITAPFKVLKEWGELGLPLAPDILAYPYDYEYKLRPIPFKNLDLDKNWRAFDIQHDLTDKGLERFADDWNALIAG